MCFESRSQPFSNYIEIVPTSHRELWPFYAFIGESVEFDVGKMPDGRLEAIKVTGPGGEKVKGQPHPKEDAQEAAEEDERGAGGKAVEDPKPKLKPYTAFMPRTVARKPAAAKPPAKSNSKPGDVMTAKVGTAEGGTTDLGTTDNTTESDVQT